MVDEEMGRTDAHAIKICALMGVVELVLRWMIVL